MFVKHSNLVPAFPVENGTGVSKSVLISADEAPHFAMRRFTIEAGGFMPLHTNQVEHEQLVLQGQAQVTIADEIYDVNAGDVLLIPAGMPHQYVNTGDGPFSFLCLVPNLPDVTRLVGK